MMELNYGFLGELEMKQIEELEEGQIQYLVIWRAKWNGEEYSDSITLDPKDALRVLRESTLIYLEENIAFAKVAIQEMKDEILEEKDPRRNE